MVFASNNKGKLKEVREILGSDIKSLNDMNISIDVVEDGKTFLDNALKKAKEVYDVCHDVVISDDSGLCIDYLDGFPGVETARFLGESASNIDRNNYILDKMKNVENRTCHVVCCIVYYDGVKEVHAEGRITGKISLDRRGENGFGFDEIFELDNGKTMAELSPSEKNKISARYLALNKLKNMI